MSLSAFNRMRRLQAQKEAAQEPQEPKGLKDMTYNELRAVAKDKNIEGYGSMKKDELLEALKSTEEGE